MTEKGYQKSTLDVKAEKERPPAKAPIVDGIVYSPYPEVEIFSGSFYEAIREACLIDPDKPILIDDSVTLTKSEFIGRVRRYAAGLQKNGVQPGDRVCVHLGNSVDNFVAMCSCVVAGASIVPVSTCLPAEELRHHIIDSDSTHLLIEPAFADQALKATSEVGLKGLFTTTFAEGFTAMAPFAEMDERAFQELDVEDPRQCLFAIIYTSGTTGLSKGVPITHYNFLANIGMSRWSFPWDECDVLLLPTPLVHGSGLLCVTINVLLSTTCVIVQPHLPFADLLKVVEEHKVTAAAFLPWHLQCLVAEAQRTNQRIKGLRRVCTGGGILTKPQYDAALQAFGSELECLVNLYAMTESLSWLCSPPRKGVIGIDVGFPAPLTQIKIVDPVTERILGPHQTGEIRFRAPTVMKGYHKRPKQTEEFFDADGWCKSGDAGYYDEDGRIHFVQRFKELIKCMDVQVVPGTLEEILLKELYNEILDACVIGIPHEKYGEAPAAVIVPRNKDKSLVNLAKRVKCTVTERCSVHWHLYGGVFFVDALPKTASGKTNRIAVLQQCDRVTAY